MTGAGDTYQPPADDSFSSAANELLDCWDRTASNFAKILGGTYTSAEALGDASECSAKALKWSQGLFTPWWSILRLLTAPPSTAVQPSSRVPAHVDPSVTHRPLTLHTTGFRAVGYGSEYFIFPTDITFEPSPRIEVGSDHRFIVNVNWQNLPPAAKVETIIYEGEVIALETNALVTEPIRFVKPAYVD